MQAIFVILWIVAGIAVYIVAGMSVAMFFDLSGFASLIVQVIFFGLCITFRMALIPCAIAAWGLYEYFDWNPLLAILVCFPGIAVAMLGGVSALLTRAKQ